MLRMSCRYCSSCTSFLFNHTATTEIYTLSLHDALPIFQRAVPDQIRIRAGRVAEPLDGVVVADVDVHEASLRSAWSRSEEHTSELQSPVHLVCRLLLEKKKKRNVFV